MLPMISARYRNKLGARLRKSAEQLVGRVDVEAQKLVLGRALQRDELEVRVRLDRGANEAHLVARLALDVEDLLAAVAHVDERLLRVVLLHLLARLHGNAKGERARAGVVARRP